MSDVETGLSIFGIVVIVIVVGFVGVVFYAMASWMNSGSH
jgi:hypothetical protein